MFTVTGKKVLFSSAAIGGGTYGYFTFQKRRAEKTVKENKLCLRKYYSYNNPLNLSSITIDAPYGVPDGNSALKIQPQRKVSQIFFNPSPEVCGPHNIQPISSYLTFCAKIMPLFKLINHDPVDCLVRAQAFWEEKELNTLELGHFSEILTDPPPDQKGNIAYFADVVKIHTIFLRKLKPSERTSKLHDLYLNGPNPCKPQVKPGDAIGLVLSPDHRFHLSTRWGSVDVGKSGIVEDLFLEMKKHFLKRSIGLATPIRKVSYRRDCDRLPSEEIKLLWSKIRDEAFKRAMSELEKSKKPYPREKSLKDRMLKTIASWLIG